MSGTKKELKKNECKDTTKNRDPIIYKTTNLINGRFYVGKDAYNKKHYIGSGTILKQAIKKYGRENFKKEILEHCSFDILNEREIYWIDKLNAINDGYNITEGGTGGDVITNNPNADEIRKKKKGHVPWNKGIPCSEEQRKKCSESQKKRFDNDPNLRYNNGSFKSGKDHILYGKERDREIVEKIIRSNKKVWKKSGRLQKVKIEFLETGKTVIYESVSEASRQTGIDKRNISERARSKSKIHKKKFKIEYINE